MKGQDYPNIETTKVIEDLLLVIQDLLPGIKHIAVQDYHQLNNAPLVARELVNKHRA